MSFYVEKTTYQPAPAGVHLARLTQLIHLGVQESIYKDEGQRQYLLGFELVEEALNDERNYTVSERFNATLGPKSKLSAAVSALTSASQNGFDLDELVGRACQVTVAHKTKPDGRVVEKITAISPIPKNMKVPEAKGDPLLYDIDDPDPESYERLPGWIRKIISEARVETKVKPRFKPKGEPKVDLEVETGIHTGLVEEETPF